MTTMHVGTFNVDQLRDTVSDDVTIIEDHDSWEVWGEAMTEFPDHPVHVMLRLDSTVELLAEMTNIFREEPHLLVPMAFHRQRGTVVCITPDDDWSEPIFTLMDTPVQRFLAYISSGDDTDLIIWRNLDWQDYLYLRETEG